MSGDVSDCESALLNVLQNMRHLDTGWGREGGAGGVGGGERTRPATQAARKKRGLSVKVEEEEEEEEGEYEERLRACLEMLWGN